MSNWDISACSGRCIKCSRSFTDGEFFWCRLYLDGDSPRREDYCVDCWGNSQKGYPNWRGRYRVQLERAVEEPLKEPVSKQLLKKYLHSTERIHQCLCYVLGILLERNKSFQPRTAMEGRIVYEDKETGEVYILTDPGLSIKELDEIEGKLLEMLKQELDRS